MDIPVIANKLSSLTGLTLERLPSVKTNTKSAPRKAIGQLVRQEYIPSYQDAPEDLKWLVEGEGDNQIDKNIHIIDLLGVYKSNTNEIILYDLLIKLCSIKLKIDYEILKQIVLVHELSHAITHLGKDNKNNIWEYFDIALTEDKEYFAQIYTYKLFEKDGNISTINAMDKLSETQLDIYQTYKNSIDTDIVEINKNLIAIRKKIPSGYEQYPEALNTKWIIKFDNLQKYEKYIGHASFHGDINHPGPKSIYKTVSEGTKFEITNRKIVISSYDYSPSSNQFSIGPSLDVYKLIADNQSEIIKSTITDISKKPIFSITIDNKEYYFNISEHFAQKLFDGVVSIIEEEYPVLAKVLRKYRQDF